MPSKPFRLAVRAIIEDEQGRSLLLRRAKPQSHDGSWEWPGGKPDEGEDFVTALKREVREETALDVDMDRVVGAYDFEVTRVRVAMLVMAAKRTGGEIALSEEHDDFAWVAPADLPAYPMAMGLDTIARLYRTQQENTANRSGE